MASFRENDGARGDLDDDAAAVDGNTSGRGQRRTTASSPALPEARNRRRLFGAAAATGKRRRCRVACSRLRWWSTGAFAVVAFCLYRQLSYTSKLRRLSHFFISYNDASGNNVTGGSSAEAAAVADPTALRRGVRLWRQQQRTIMSPSDDDGRRRRQQNGSIQRGDGGGDGRDNDISYYFDVLSRYHSFPDADDDANNSSKRNDDSSSKSWVYDVCNASPGGSRWEDIGGWQLLTRKIRVYRGDDDRNKLKLFCGVYTHDKMRNLARTAALSWGQKCDGFVAFSTESVPQLGFVHLQHEGEESYHNMWQKVRGIWAYVAEYYLDQYDYFHLGGDDMYVIVENLRYFLKQHQQQLQQRANHTNATDDIPVFLGQWVRQKSAPIASGGPGYTLNRAALRKFASEALPTCYADKRASYEDKLMSLCLRSVGIPLGDARDPSTGEQLYHDVPPHQVYASKAASGRGATFHSRGQAYWETLPHPLAAADNNGSSASNGTAVGPKYGLDAAGTYSVSFHNLHSPEFMARIHAILYPKTSCPADSLLGQSLRAASSSSREIA